MNRPHTRLLVPELPTTVHNPLHVLDNLPGDNPFGQASSVDCKLLTISRRARPSFNDESTGNATLYRLIRRSGQNYQDLKSIFMALLLYCRGAVDSDMSQKKPMPTGTASDSLQLLANARTSPPCCPSASSWSH